VFDHSRLESQLVLTVLVLCVDVCEGLILVLDHQKVIVMVDMCRQLVPLETNVYPVGIA
jgi:hypothetical protein